MPRFLSPQWFDAVRAHSDRDQPGDPQPPRLLIEQVVTESPFGNVNYFVAVENGTARLLETSPNGRTADLRITTDWGTAAAIARGELATQAALMQGKLRIRGNMSKLAGGAGELAGLDPVPEAVRRATTY
jgi:SCP-2 sterol transfer family